MVSPSRNLKWLAGGPEGAQYNAAFATKQMWLCATRLVITCFSHRKQEDVLLNVPPCTFFPFRLVVLPCTAPGTNEVSLVHTRLHLLRSKRSCAKFICCASHRGGLGPFVGACMPTCAVRLLVAILACFVCTIV